jgi:hypothetical protein
MVIRPHFRVGRGAEERGTLAHGLRRRDATRRDETHVQVTTAVTEQYYELTDVSEKCAASLQRVYV